MPYIGKSPSFGVRNRFVYVADADDTSVSGADANGSTLTFTDGAFVDVYLNGVLLKPTTDYNTSTANTIAGLSALSANDEVTVVVYDVFAVGDTVSAVNGGTFSGNVTFNGDISVGDDVSLASDGAIINFGADSEVTLTHVADTGLLMNDKLSISTADNDDQLELISTDADASGGPAVRFYRNSSSPADNDSLLTMRIEGNNDNSQVVVYNRLRADIIDASDGTEDSSFHIFNMMAGTERTMFSIKPDEVVVNEEGQDVDFRVESDNDANSFFVQGSTGNIGVGTNSPNSGYRIHALNSSGGSGILAEATGTGNESYYQLKFVNSSGTSRTAMIKGDNGDSLRIASANAISIGMETSDSQALSIGTDGSLRLQHVYDDTTSNSANMYIHSDGTHQVMRSTSSERYKKDIETLEDKYADAVLGLRPVWYKSKCEADNPDFSHWGLIAEEVAKVDPRLVTFRNEYTEDIGDGKYKVVKLDAPQAESVQYDRFVPHLINICKRQEDKITALEAKVKTLEEA